MPDENIAPWVKCDACNKQTQYTMTNHGDGQYCPDYWAKKFGITIYKKG